MPEGTKKVFITALTETSLEDLEGVGTIRWQGNKAYKWVKYIDGAGDLDIVLGDVLVYVAAKYKLSEVTADLTDAAVQPIGAGLAVGTVTVDLTFMWMQIKGPALLSLDPAGAGADGDVMAAGADTSGTDKVVIIDPADNLTRMGTITDDTAKEVVLDCPF